MDKPNKYVGWSPVGAARARKREAEREAERKALDAEPLLPAREDAITLGQEMLPVRRGPGKVERVSVDDMMLVRLMERALTKPTISSVKDLYARLDVEEEAMLVRYRTATRQQKAQAKELVGILSEVLTAQRNKLLALGVARMEGDTLKVHPWVRERWMRPRYESS